MQEHPVPRQITTFEFKLIGELTIKQFGYLAFGAAASVIIFFLVPKFFYINIILAIIPAVLAIGFAFVPVNDRPMDIYLKNLIKRLFSPTQYFFHKNNAPPKILMGLQLPPRDVLLQYVKAQQSLNEYMQKKPKTESAKNIDKISKDIDTKKQLLQSLINTSGSVSVSTREPQSTNYTEVSLNNTRSQAIQEQIPTSTVQDNALQNNPDFSFSGVVTTSTGVPLPNQMVYVKKGSETVRLFKTDRDGRFQNNLPLQSGDYFLEVIDPQKKHNFAKMKLAQSSQLIEIRAN